MNRIGRKIYYDIALGDVIQDTGEREGAVIETTIDQDIATFTALSERNRDTFEVIELPFGTNKQDFTECTGYRVNLTTKELEFSYPDPNAPVEEPVYQKPLSVQNSELQAAQESLSVKNAGLQQTIVQMSTDFQALTDYLAELGVI